MKFDFRNKGWAEEFCLLGYNAMYFVESQPRNQNEAGRKLSTCFMLVS
jgi:hypothetical protein